MSKPKPQTAALFPNGSIMVFDQAGKQIAELQESPITLWAQRAESLGYDVAGLQIECRGEIYRLFKCETGWNREMIGYRS